MLSRFTPAITRLRDELPLLVRTLAACITTYVVIGLIFPGKADMTGTLTALLISQASVVGTFRSVFDRLAAVIAGVYIAVWLSHYLSINALSLTLAIGLSLLVGTLAGFGDNRLEVPISAMLILAASQQEVASELRMINTLIGAGIGLGVTMLFPLPPKLKEAVSAVENVIEQTATAVESVASSIQKGESPAVTTSLKMVTEVQPELQDAKAIVKDVRESFLMNTTAAMMPVMVEHKADLMGALNTLEECLPQFQQLIVTFDMDRALSTAKPEVSEELRQGYAAALDSSAAALRYFSNMMGSHEDVDVQREMFLRSLRDLDGACCLLRELVTLPVDANTEQVAMAFLDSITAIYYHLEHGAEQEFRTSVGQVVRDVLNPEVMSQARRAKRLATTTPAALKKTFVRHVKQRTSA